ncbi:hypothetical protein BEWA_023650 [Theileria equi strain WA]|uniref:Uncharacterized protein n=1 Tax=Theileria equi strain WA TaxID=1537102 RepID=L0AWW8_THEEQ|nr:hypothetical protein BEWA_023650 [Theileria equi strain WA]AFZ79516.1 hypothetical protein BEWA_023650 [Theileria equi strain WA]|eukprot:XP_004829182.1 hypothetical protein BEWA_023650 [Theileria equi strain WA]
MSAEQTCTNGTHVDIDISKTAVGGKYKDACDNTINVENEENKPEKGYKKYTHSFSSNCSIKNINHNGTKQNGFPLTETVEYNKGVAVYYLSYDATNALPLIVGLEKSTGTDNYYYYKKDSYSLISNQWTGEDPEITEEHQLPEKLKEIIKNLTTVIILRVDHVKNNTYFASGDTSPPPTINETLKIEVTGPSPIHKIYEKYTHTPVTAGSNIRLLSTKTSSKNIPFDPPVYEKKYSEAYVYFWEWDKTFSNPLLIQLGDGNTSVYYTYYSGSNSWRNPGNITDSNLKDKLNEQNCEKNDAHVIDISKTSDGPYECPSCNYKQISVTEMTSTYGYYLHVVSNGYISRLKNGGAEQAGIKLPKDANQVFVFCSPKTSGNPLLIGLSATSDQSNVWYQRIKDPDTWSGVPKDRQPTGQDDEDGEISGLLQEIDKEIKQGLGSQSNGDGGGSDSAGESGAQDEELEARNSHSGSGEESGAGHGSDGSQNTFQQILGFITSHYGKISGGLGATGGLIGLGIWKGPSILARLITRL